MRSLSLAALALFFAFGFIWSDHAPDEKTKPGAPLFGNLGKRHYRVTTKSPQAQRYFDQGLTLVYGFNHAEAIRSFHEAARIDPECAMAWWGIALAHGPNINAPMKEEAVPKAFAALQKALKLAPKVSAREQAYIQALAKRYVAKPEKDRKALDQAYAEAMRRVAKAYPEDADVLTHFAEALMDTMPWDYWTEAGKARPATKEVLAALEKALRLDPDHPGANHYYIHAVEASPNPERGLASAHRLRDLVPGAGHLVHMPSHIYLRVGMYHQASQANERAITADDRYMVACRAQGFYPAAYASHNHHFLWYSTSLEGRSRDCIEAGRKTAEMVRLKATHYPPILRWMGTARLLALVRFGHWEEVLAEPRPKGLYEEAMWHYARGLAFTRQKKGKEATQEAKRLTAIASGKEIDALEDREFPAASVVRLAEPILTAEVAGVRGDSPARLRHLSEAVRRQDKLPYMEPPFWYFPVRQLLGAALLEAGEVAKAETVYREDLRRHPSNGWSLFGLLQCLRRQGKTAEAATVQRRFREAWQRADVVLTASCF